MGTTSDLTKSAARDLVSSVDTFLIDCDGSFVHLLSLLGGHVYNIWLLAHHIRTGVIWCGNEAVEGAQEAIAQLRKQVKQGRSQSLRFGGTLENCLKSVRVLDHYYAICD